MDFSFYKIITFIACSLPQHQENSAFPFFEDQSLIAGQTTVVFVDRVKTP